MKRLSPQVIVGIALVGIFLVWNVSTRIYLKNKQPYLGKWERTSEYGKHETLFLIPESSGSLVTVDPSPQGNRPDYSYMDFFEWHEKDGVIVFDYHVRKPQDTDITRTDNTREVFKMEVSDDHRELMLTEDSKPTEIFTRQ